MLAPQNSCKDAWLAVDTAGSPVNERRPTLQTRQYVPVRSVILMTRPVASAENGVTWCSSAAGAVCSEMFCRAQLEQVVTWTFLTFWNTQHNLSDSTNAATFSYLNLISSPILMLWTAADQLRQIYTLKSCWLADEQIVPTITWTGV